MEKFTLKSFESLGAKNYTIYTYENKGGSKKASFHLHPTKSFSFVCDEIQNLTKKEFQLLCDSFIIQGIKQHEYKGGFYQAIKILNIN